jgi:DnaB-like helicase N terminal domain/AAA domain
VSNDDHRHHLHPVPNHPEDQETRTPPNNPDAERAVLGGMLMSKTAIDDCTLILAGKDFYSPAHELIFDTIAGLYARLQPVDVITVADTLTKTKDLGRIGGAAYLHELVEAAPITTGASYHAQIVGQQATRRRLVEAGIRIQTLGYAPDTDDTELLQTASSALAGVPSTIPGIDNPATTNTWAPVDLTDILAGDDTEGPVATTLTRRDGKALLYPAAVHSISGEPGSGKTWAALVAIAQELENNNDALFIDFEDRPQTIVNRLRALGTTDQAIAAHLAYIRPEVALNPTSRALLEQAATSCTIAVIDGITEAMTMHGLSLMDNEDVARWLALVPRALADLGPAVLQIDHVVKNADARGRYAIGGQHKLAGITGVAYKMLTIRSFGRGVKGHAKLVIDKDKHGDVGPNGVTAADLHLDATNPDGSLYAWLDTPGDDHTETGEWRPTGYMHKVSLFLQLAPGANTNEIVMGVRGKKAHIVSAIQALITEGNVRVEPGPRNASHHYVETPFDEDNQ